MITVRWQTPLSSGIARFIALCALALSGCGTETISPAYSNNPPEVLALLVLPGDSTEVNDTLTFTADAEDIDNHPLHYQWLSEFGRFIDTTSIVARRSTRPDTFQTALWIAPNRANIYGITLSVSDPFTTVDSTHDIFVLNRGATNRPPEIVQLTAEPDTVSPEGIIDVIVQAIDAEGDALTYIWNTDVGMFFPESGPHVQWIAPLDTIGEFYLKVTAIDGHHYVTDSIAVSVVPDTTVVFTSDFTTDQVTGQWATIGLLGGLGDNEGTHSVEWDSTAKAMAIVANSNYGTYGFKLVGRNFDEGTFSCNVKVPNPQYGRIAFVPKMIDQNNYLIVGINPFQGSWQVLRCAAGATQYLAEGWETFDLGLPVRFTYSEAGGRATASVNGRMLWSGATAAPFDHPVPLGVALYGVGPAEAALFDDVRVTVP